MTNTIKCQSCGAEIEITEAFSHQIREEVVASEKEKFQNQLESVKKESEKRNTEYLDQIKSLLEELGKLRRKDEEMEVEMKKKLLEAEERIRSEALTKSDELHKLKELEMAKTIDDLKKSLSDAQKVAAQGSQQNQGESLELELERLLRGEFPSDEITEVKKGQKGADVTQRVVDKLGRSCGVILWEVKNAQWSEGWIGKLKEDQRGVKAELSVLVSVNLPEDIKNFAYRNGVWVTSLGSFLSLASALRFNLISLFHERSNLEGRDEKAAILYQYLTGIEFRQRIEGIVESFGSLQDELEREKRWFNTKWARQEKEIRKVIDHTHGMYGDLQGVIGKSLPELNSFTQASLPENSQKLDED